jgi:hypothetical protein
MSAYSSGLVTAASRHWGKNYHLHLSSPPWGDIIVAKKIPHHHCNPPSAEGKRVCGKCQAKTTIMITNTKNSLLMTID